MRLPLTRYEERITVLNCWLQNRELAIRSHAHVPTNSFHNHSKRVTAFRRKAQDTIHIWTLPLCPSAPVEITDRKVPTLNPILQPVCPLSDAPHHLQNPRQHRVIITPGPQSIYGRSCTKNHKWRWRGRGKCSRAPIWGRKAVRMRLWLGLRRVVKQQ